MRYLTLAAVAAAVSLAILPFIGSAAAKEPPGPPTIGAIVVHMDEQNGSGLDGRAEIMPADGGAKTFVQVFINEVEPGSSHAAMLHLGCTGPIDVNLNPVVAQAGVTTGRSVTTVDRAFSQIADGNHVVDVHGDDGSVVACGQIPAQPALPPEPEVLPPAGSGPAQREGVATALGVLLIVGIATAGAGTAFRRTRPHKE